MPVSIPPQRRRPPPNYMSRAVQWRLLVPVFMLMLVLVLMERARDPKYYEWMFAGDRQSAAEHAAPAADASIVAQARPDRSVDRSPTPPLDPLELARRDGWDRVLSSLSDSQRSALVSALVHHRQQKPFEISNAADWTTMIDTLDAAWNDYLAQARKSLPSTDASAAAAADADAEPSEEVDWHRIVDQLNSDRNDTLTALHAVTDGSKLSAAQADLLATVQAALDRTALRQIEDNTVFQPEEREAWFRLFERLQSDEHHERPPRQTQRFVNYLQLIEQPEVYRASKVRVRGTARLGYQLDAVPNELGIKQYAVLWIQPEDSASSPIVAYCTSLPEGFPQLAQRTGKPSETALDEPVEISGYFFKRLAYRAREGVHVAPLILAGAPQWLNNGPPPRVGMHSDEVLIAVVGGLALGLAGLMFLRRTLWSQAPPQGGLVLDFEPPGAGTAGQGKQVPPWSTEEGEAGEGGS